MHANIGSFLFEERRLGEVAGTLYRGPRNLGVLRSRFLPAGTVDLADCPRPSRLANRSSRNFVEGASAEIP